MTNYKYILFDWDGTLVKTLDVWIGAYKEVANNLGIDLSSYSDKEVVDTFFGKLGGGYKEFGVTDTQVVYEQVKKIVDENVKHVPVYPNVKTTLERLHRKNIKMALHTTSNKNLLYSVIEASGLEQYFEIILTKDVIEKPKPDPEVILKEIDYFGAKPEECLVVGDSESDLKAANNANVDSVLVFPESHNKFYRKEDLLKNKPKFVINNLLDLLKVVN